MKQNSIIIMWVPLASTLFKFVFDIIYGESGKVSVALRHYGHQEKLKYTNAQLGLSEISSTLFFNQNDVTSVIKFPGSLTSIEEVHLSLFKYIQAFKILYLTNTSIKL